MGPSSSLTLAEKEVASPEEAPEAPPAPEAVSWSWEETVPSCSAKPLTFPHFLQRQLAGAAVGTGGCPGYIWSGRRANPSQGYFGQGGGSRAVSHPSLVFRPAEPQGGRPSPRGLRITWPWRGCALPLQTARGRRPRGVELGAGLGAVGGASEAAEKEAVPEVAPPPAWPQGCRDRPEGRGGEGRAGEGKLSKQKHETRGKQTRTRGTLTNVGTISGRALRRDFTAWKTSTTSSVSALSRRFSSAQNRPVC